MSEFDELEAMKKIAEALEPLEDAARQRALQWAISRYRGKPISEISTLMNASGSAGSSQIPTAGEYETFAELFEAAKPGTEKEKALVASYWAQMCLNQPSFASQTLNVDLKNLGHGIGNITDALTQLKNDRPALVLQLKKSGTSKQARKTYKLTQEGVKRVRGMINGINE